MTKSIERKTFVDSAGTKRAGLEGDFSVFCAFSALGII